MFKKLNMLGDVTIDGKLTSDETYFVDGEAKVSYIKIKKLYILENGYLIGGYVEAESIVNYGRLKGKIIANEIYDHGEIEGEIHTKKLYI